jgi:hypothetical protein
LIRKLPKLIPAKPFWALEMSREDRGIGLLRILHRDRFIQQVLNVVGQPADHATSTKISGSSGMRGGRRRSSGDPTPAGFSVVPTADGMDRLEAISRSSMAAEADPQVISCNSRRPTSNQARAVP